MSAPALRVANLTIETGQQTIVPGLSFDVCAGEIVGLFGDSGTGKSTILHSIAGLLAGNYRQSGEISLAGRPLANLPPDERSRLGVSILMQGRALFSHLSVLENVMYPLRRRNMPEPEAKRTALRSLAQLRVDSLHQRRVSEISGGEYQRVSLARAMVYGPRLLMLDEPLTGLQDELRFEFLAHVRALCRGGMAILLVTHQRDELDLVADRVVSIARGAFSVESRRPASPFESLQLRLPTALSEAHNRRLPADKTSAPLAEILEIRQLGSGRTFALAGFADGRVGWVNLATNSRPPKVGRLYTIHAAPETILKTGALP